MAGRIDRFLDTLGFGLKPLFIITIHESLERLLFLQQVAVVMALRCEPKAALPVRKVIATDAIRTELPRHMAFPQQRRRLAEVQCRGDP